MIARKRILHKQEMVGKTQLGAVSKIQVIRPVVFGVTAR